MRFMASGLPLMFFLAACGGAGSTSDDSNGNATRADTANKQAETAASAQRGLLEPFVQKNDTDFILLPERGTDKNAFVPKGWNLVKSAKGDLNKDGHADLLMVMRQSDPANIGPLDKNSDERFDSNRYRLAAAFFDPVQKDYLLAFEDHRLIPRHEDPALADPFTDIGIAKGVMRVRLGIFPNLGGWGAESRTLSFRWGGGAFQLIGVDSVETRNPGDFTSRSLNYLTRKMKVEVGHIEDEGEGEVAWKPLPGASLRKLGEIGNGLELKIPEG